MMKRKKKQNNLRWLFYFLDIRIFFLRVFLGGGGVGNEMLDLSSLPVSLSLTLTPWLSPAPSFRGERWREG